MNRLKWGFLAVLIVFCYLGSSYYFESESREFIQKKTGLYWPKETKGIRVFEMPGLIRTHWIEAFLILPQDFLENKLKDHFTPYDPRYARAWFECQREGLNYGTWKAQTSVFQIGENPFKFFVSSEKIGDHKLKLGRNIYYSVGDKTGFNRYAVVIDSSNGNTWIHVSYPE